MREKDKQLLLIDLSARLFYKVIVKSVGENKVIGLRDLRDIDNLPLPYLRPMSSMTEEEIDEFTQFEIYADGEYIMPNYRAIDWLDKNMFDYRGLIPKGLAIEVTESNNPYKD